jgi:hypothetical protein
LEPIFHALFLAKRPLRDQRSRTWGREVRSSRRRARTASHSQHKRRETGSRSHAGFRAVAGLETRMVASDRSRASPLVAAAGQRWGTRGPRFKSGRPDERGARKPGLFVREIRRSGIGSDALACGRMTDWAGASYVGVSSTVHSPPTSRRRTFPQFGQRRFVASRSTSPGALMADSTRVPQFGQAS